MQNAPIPADEQKRLATVMNLGILDTKPEERFDAITKRAVERFGVPISTISILDKDREWYKSCQGVDAKQGDRNISFCGHALLSEFVFVIEDTTKDERFADNPYVIGPPYIRFYAGVALHDVATHQPVGVLCIKDTKPRKFSPQDVQELIELGKWADNEVNKQA